MYCVQLCNTDTVNTSSRILEQHGALTCLPWIKGYRPSNYTTLRNYTLFCLHNISCIWMEDTVGLKRPCHTTPHNTVHPGSITFTAGSRSLSNENCPQHREQLSYTGKHMGVTWPLSGTPCSMCSWPVILLWLLPWICIVTHTRFTRLKFSMFCSIFGQADASCS